METTTVYQCPDCEDVFEDEGELEALYECGNCGTVFTRSNSYSGDNHQCPECLKFSSKLSDHGCPSCGEGECEEKQMVEKDGNWYEPDDPDVDDSEEGEEEEPPLKPISRADVDAQTRDLVKRILDSD